MIYGCDLICGVRPPGAFSVKPYYKYFVSILILAAFVCLPAVARANDDVKKVSNNETVSAALTGSGEDRYTIEVSEGGGLAASVSNVGACDPRSMLEIEILDPDGNLVLGGGSPCYRLEFAEQLPAGTWTIAVRPVSGSVTEPIAYELRVVQAPGARGTRMTFGEFYKGGIHRGGIDVYVLNGTPGLLTQVTLLSNDTDIFHNLTIIAPDGTLVTSGGSAGRIDHDFPMSAHGKYTLMVWRGPDNEDVESTYGLYAKRFGDADPAEVAMNYKPPEPSPDHVSMPDSEMSREAARLGLVKLRNYSPVMRDKIKTPNPFPDIYQYGMFMTYSLEDLGKDEILAAEKGDIMMQVRLGDEVYRGRIATDEIIRWWLKAASLGNKDAINRLGIAGAKDAAGRPYEAADWYRRVVAQGKMPPEAREARRAMNNFRFAQAMNEYRAIAEKGNAAAQFNLAVLYSLGLDAPPDFTEAAKWYSRAAEQGLIVAWNNLGKLYEHGQGIRQDDKKAAELYGKAADAGYPPALYNLARLAAAGRGMPRNKTKAAAWLRQAAAEGHPDAQAELYALQGDMAQAVDLWKKSAAFGNRIALRRLIALYRKNGIPEKDFDEVLGLYRMAADKENPEVYAALGDLFAHRASPDYPESYFWYRLAARPVKDLYLYEDEKSALVAYVEGRAAEVETKLTPEQALVVKWRIRDRYPEPLSEEQEAALEIFERGGEAWDEGRMTDALAFLLQAADKGIPRAHLLLGRAYAHGHGVMRNIDKAIEYYKTAFRSGHVGAAHQIGKFNQFGIGVPVDIEKAVKWYELDASRGYEASVKHLGDIYMDGTPEGAQKTITLYEKAAARGFVQANNTLGMIYLYGMGVPADHRKALNWYLKSAAVPDPTGTVQASAILAIYEPHDYSRAIELLHAYRTPVAINNLAYMYENGLGVKKQEGSTNLSLHLDFDLKTEGYGVSELTDPFKLYKVAADRCYGRAMFNVARMLDEQGNPNAREWMRKAARHGSAAATAWLNQLPLDSIPVEVTLPPPSCEDMAVRNK